MINFKVIKYVILFAAFTCSRSLLAQNLPEFMRTGAITGSQIAELEEKVLLERINDGKSMSLPVPMQKLPEDDKLYNVWQGNRPYMRANIESFRLDFAKDIALGSDNSKGDNSKKDISIPESGEFSLDFEFQPDGIILKHSNPEYPAEKGGLRVPKEKLLKSRNFYVRGKNKQSLIIYLPALAPTEKSRAALICPRDFFSTGSREEKASLQDSAYAITRASAVVKAEMNAYFKNPIDFVLANAKMIVSPGVSLPLTDFDSSYSKDASVALYYKPKEGEVSDGIEDINNFSLGVENYLSLHLSTGYKRVSRQSAGVYIKKVNLDNIKDGLLQTKDIVGTELESELRLRKIPLNNQGLIPAKVKPGSCYLVLYRILPIIHEYLKEEFKAPES